jgi:hypothetical protein
MTWKPIDPETLTPEQRKLWDDLMTKPLEPSVTQAFAEDQFRWICKLEGIPLADEAERAAAWKAEKASDTAA